MEDKNMARKMSKQVVSMVESCNEYLRNNKVLDLTNETFNFMCYALSKAGCYHGYNYYKYKTVGDNIMIAHEIEKPEFLQIEIK